jgi:hypothetical protein
MMRPRFLWSLLAWSPLPSSSGMWQVLNFLDDFGGYPRTMGRSVSNSAGYSQESPSELPRDSQRTLLIPKDNATFLTSSHGVCARRGVPSIQIDGTSL